MDLEKLKVLGLTASEARVYTSLLKAGSATIGKLTEETGMYRKNVSDALSRLSKRGLVGITFSNTKYYTPSNPESLANLIREKETALREILPALNQYYKHPKLKQKVNFYPGKEGLKTVLLGVLENTKELDCFGTSGKAPKVLPAFLKRFYKEKVAKGIKMRIIMNHTPAGIKRGKKLSKIPKTLIRYLPKEYISPATIYVFGNKTAIMLWSEIAPFAVLIEDDEVTQGFRNHFDWWWENTRKQP